MHRAAFDVPSTASSWTLTVAQVGFLRLRSVSGKPHAHAARSLRFPLHRARGRAPPPGRGLGEPGSSGPTATPLGRGAPSGQPWRLPWLHVVLRRRLQHPRTPAAFSVASAAPRPALRAVAARARRAATRWRARPPPDPSACSASLPRSAAGRPSSSSNQLGAEVSASRVYQASSGC